MAAHIADDVTDVDVVTDILEREQVHTVFHLAAQTIMAASTADPARTYQLNVCGTAAVAEAVRRHRMDRRHEQRCGLRRAPTGRRRVKTPPAAACWSSGATAPPRTCSAATATTTASPRSAAT